MLYYAKIFKREANYNDPLNLIGLEVKDNLLKIDFSQIKAYFLKKIK